MQIETDIEICYRTTVGDCIEDTTDKKVIDGYINRHIQEYCEARNLEYSYVKILGVSITKEQEE
jgi:hypothetical protein